MAEAIGALLVWGLALLAGLLDVLYLTLRSHLAFPLRPLTFALGLALIRWTSVVGSQWFFSTFMRNVSLSINGDQVVVAHRPGRDAAVFPKSAVRAVAMGEGTPRPRLALRQMFSFARPTGPAIGAGPNEIGGYWYTISHSAVVLMLSRLGQRPNLIVRFQPETPLVDEAGKPGRAQGASVIRNEGAGTGGLVATVANPAVAAEAFERWVSPGR